MSTIAAGDGERRCALAMFRQIKARCTGGAADNHVSNKTNLFKTEANSDYG